MWVAYALAYTGLDIKINRHIKLVLDKQTGCSGSACYVHFNKLVLHGLGVFSYFGQPVLIELRSVVRV